MTYDEYHAALQEHLNRRVDPLVSLRLFQQGVALMDAVVRLGAP